MKTIAISSMEDGGQNVPVRPVVALDCFVPDLEVGTAARYRYSFIGGEHLDALLFRKPSETLVVTFHGAVDRNKTSLPRFERLRSMVEFETSGLHLADPALWRNDVIQLAWYTGWTGVDVHEICANWAISAAKAVGANRIIFTGSSGGGFAALQVATYVPGSLALAFNPQTSIRGYLADNYSWGPQKYYMKTNWPDCVPEGGLDAVPYYEDWTKGIDDRVSPLRRYMNPVGNDVHFVINKNEFHYEHHYLPFLGAAALGGNLPRITRHEYEGGIRHNPPTPDIFQECMIQAMNNVKLLRTSS